MKKLFFIFSFVFFLAALALFYFSRKPAAPIKKTNIEKMPTPTEKSMRIIPLSLEKFFFGDKKYLSKLPPDELITIISTGDIIPAREVNMKSTQAQDFTWAFKNVWETMKSADLTVANLEAPLMKNCIATSEGMTFCGSDKHIEGLRQAGIDLVTLANNHSDNYGMEGILETAKLLKLNNIYYTGINGPEFLTIKNIRFAFLGYNFLLDQDMTKIAREVAEAKKNSDIVVVFPHWGTEYEEIPSTFQSETQKKLLNAGADIILGNHPHIVQPLTINNSQLTFFAHGNFIFDQMWSEETKKGFFTKIYIYNGRLIDVGIFPIYIKDFGQPEIVTGEEREKMIRELYKLSLKYSSL